MPACAAIPTFTDTENENRIQLFYNTTGKSLGLSLKAGDATDPLGYSYSATDKAPDGIIVNPSQFGAKFYKGMSLVAGFTTVKPVPGQDSTENNVSLLSPVYRDLVRTEDTHKTIAVSSSGEKAWVYYFSGADESHLKLQEYSLPAGKSSALNVNGVLAGSSLAAYTPPKSDARFIIYQDGNDSMFRDFSVQNQSPATILSSNNALKGTTMAVAYDPKSKRAFLYYLDNNYYVNRIIKDAGGNWGGSSIFNKTKVDKSSQLTATIYDGIVHVFFVSDGSSAPEFEHPLDDTTIL